MDYPPTRHSRRLCPKDKWANGKKRKEEERKTVRWKTTNFPQLEIMNPSKPSLMVSTTEICFLFGPPVVI